MSERVEILRQEARAEAAARAARLADALIIGHTKHVPAGPADVAYGETACPRCGVRSGVGCTHRTAGDTTAQLSSFERRRSLT